jgi:N-acetylneuraminic acid mutarotase
VAAASAAELFGEIYVVGGRLADGQATDVVEVYSPTQNAWRPVTSLPQPVAGGLALSDGAFLYLFGGWNGSAYLDTTYVYDPGEDRWRPLAEMPQPRAFVAGQFMTGRLYVVGGFDGDQELAVCHYFNPNLEEWFTCPDMLLARGKAGSAAVLNKLYVIGGGMNGRQEITFSERYDPTTETWQVVNSPLLAESPTWTGLGVANVENRIFVFGGHRGDVLNPDTYIYSPFVYRTFLPSVPVGGGSN